MAFLARREQAKGEQTNMEADYVISYRFATTGEVHSAYCHEPLLIVNRQVSSS